ncbi:MAG: hypothetical protein ATN35_05680 [Epulopiscium sp. Nele67-Bin004]|nr:MAG: hypothetical protein ATN35_05680 [Epulopiscium sp. Nele67-Bin004]
MNRLSDMLDELEDINITEEELENALDGISETDILKLALEGINQSDVEERKITPITKFKKRGNPMKKMTLMAAAATLALTSTIVVAQTMPQLATMFDGATSYIRHNVVSADIKPKILSEIVMTTAEAILDEDAGFLLFVFERKDGGIFDDADFDNAYFKSSDMDYKKSNIASSGAKSLYLSEDKKQLIGVWTADTISGFNLGTNITVQFEDIIRRDDYKETTDITLLDVQNALATSSGIAVGDESRGNVIESMELSDGILSINTTFKENNDLQWATTVYLVDARTGERIWMGSEGDIRQIDGYATNGRGFCEVIGLTEEDFPYIQIALDHSGIEYIVQDKWSATLPLDSTVETTTYMTDVQIPMVVDAEDTTLTQIDVSKININLHLSNSAVKENGISIPEAEEVLLLLEDGTHIPMQHRISKTEDGKLYWMLEPAESATHISLDDAYKINFIPVEEVVAVVINGQEIVLE